MSTITNTPPPAAPIAAASTQATDTGISLQDLQNLLAAIDVAAQRGAYRAPEMSQIGQLFDKVNRFVVSVTPPAAPQQPVPSVSALPQTPTPVAPMAPPFAPKVS